MTKAGVKKEYVLDDLDIAILAALPAFGSKHGKYLDHGVGVAQLPGLVDSTLTSLFLGGRVRSLQFQGYVRTVKGGSSRQVGASYQRTEKGDATVAKAQTTK